jgi:phospholipid/cholesterol/gamma-HCH transport system substrate-binding protein
VSYSDSPRTRGRGISPLRAGLLALVLIGLGTFFGFTKQNPFANPYELHAIFDSANRLQERSPVRIAGVNVGKVTGVESLGDGSGKARVTMEIDDSGLPIRQDAELKVRSRLFLEGNYFVDLHPGRPGSPELDSGATIGPNQTAAPVQYLQLLTALQTETREDLQRLLKEYSDALRGRGARGFNQAVKHWEEAWRTTSQVSDAYRGHGPHDLSGLLDGQARVYGALSSNQGALMELVTDLNDTVSGFARQEDNLRAAIPELRDVLREGRPALASLDSALPEIRAFARDALPGARSSKATLDAQLPFIAQARRLVSREELGGLATRLRRTVPFLVSLNRGTSHTLEQNRALASCQNNVLLPFATAPIPDPDFDWHTGEPWYEESPRAFVGLAGESRIADANSPMFRVLAGGGPTTIVSTPKTMDGPIYGQTLVPLDGVRPVAPTRRPVFRPDIPCETQEPPDLHAAGGPADQQVEARADRPPTAPEREAREDVYERLRDFVERSRKGLPARDPLTYFPELHE